MFLFLLGKPKVFRFNQSFLNNFTVCKQFYSNLKINGGKKFKFESLINLRQQEAKRSILVQVPSKNACGSLHNYCQQFGSITKSYYYSVQSNLSKYVLIEFKDAHSVNHVIESSFHLGSNDVPVTSRFFEFDPKKYLKNGNKYKEVPVLDKPVTPTIPLLCNTLKNCNTIEDQLKKFYELTCLSDADIRLRYFGAHQVELTLSGVFPHTKIYPFGSSVNGFGRIGSDLDLVLTIDSNDQIKDYSHPLKFHTRPQPNDDRQFKRRYLSILGDIIDNILPGVTDVRRILHARVPIIKYQQKCLDLEVDISNSDLSGLYMSKLLFLLSEVDERIRPLVFFIRAWAKQTGLTNSSIPGHWITNFSLTSLVIFYFQQLSNPILPPLNHLIKNESENISESIKNLPQIEFQTTNTMSMHELLIGFFSFYENLNFLDKAISMQSGTLTDKPIQDPMYILNPLDETLNISRNLNAFECNRFNEEAKKAVMDLVLNANKKTTGSWGITQFFSSEIVQTEVKTKQNFNIANILKKNGSLNYIKHESNTKQTGFKTNSLDDFSRNIRRRHKNSKR